MRHTAGRASTDAWKLGGGVAIESIDGGPAAGGVLARFAGTGLAGQREKMARAGDAANFWMGAGGGSGYIWNRAQSAGVSHVGGTEILNVVSGETPDTAGEDARAPQAIAKGAMKLHLTLAKPRPLSRAEVWGCVTANLAVPGSGSLAAGRAVGYVQMAVYFTGFIISLVGAVGTIHWYMANSTQVNNPQEGDIFGPFLAFLHAARWALLGIAIFIFALSWAAITSFQIVQAQRKDAVPPRIV